VKKRWHVPNQKESHFKSEREVKDRDRDTQREREREREREMAGVDDRRRKER